MGKKTRGRGDKLTVSQKQQAKEQELVERIYALTAGQSGGQTKAPVPPPRRLNPALAHTKQCPPTTCSRS